MANRLQRNPEPLGHWATQRNGDILLRMALQVQAGHAGEVHKIKAHQGHSAATDPTHWFHICGNDRADQAAKAAQGHDAHDFVTMVRAMQDREREATEYIFPFYVYIARLAKRIIQFTAQVKKGQQPGHQPMDLSGLMVQGPHYQPRWTTGQLDDGQLQACYMTATVAEAIMRWLPGVRWPNEPQPSDPGVSWVELFLSFKYDQQMEMPFSMVSKDPRPVYRLRAQLPEASLLPARGSDEIKVFQTIMKAMAGLLGVAILPMDYKGKCYSMKRYGFKQWGHLGFTMRPQLPNAQRIHQTLEDMESSQEPALIREVLNWSLPAPEIHPSDQTRDPLQSYAAFQARFRGRA